MEIADAPDGALIGAKLPTDSCGSFGAYLTLWLPHFSLIRSYEHDQPPCCLAPSIFTAAEMTRIDCASESTTDCSQACLRVRAFGLICVSALGAHWKGGGMSGGKSQSLVGKNSCSLTSLLLDGLALLAALASMRSSWAYELTSATGLAIYSSTHHRSSQKPWLVLAWASMPSFTNRGELLN